MNKEENNPQNHIQLAINFTDLIRTTLGPRGMNKMVVKDDKIKTLTNDGATIINNLKGGNPIVDLFKNLAKSQEEAVGDGTTTSVILAGQLLKNAQDLINKGIHPTTIINGYNVGLANSLNFLESKKEKGDLSKIIKTAFGTKINPDLIRYLTEILIKIKDPHNLKFIKINNSDPFKTEIFKGHIFEGFTRNELMEKKVKGKVAILDFPVNLKFDNFSVTNAEELEKVTNFDMELKKGVVDELVKNGVKWVFYTDTCKEFDAYLTDAKISGVAIFRPEDTDAIAKSLNARPITNKNQIEGHIGYGEIKYEKGVDSNPGRIYVKGDMETLILHGPTTQTLDEIERAVDDCIRLMRHDISMIVGAGSIEIETAKYLRKIKLEGKEQLALEKFAESLESIPMMIAENCGLDSIDILTKLRASDEDFGVDIRKGISNAREREIFEPVLVKKHALFSATNVCNLILKMDAILQG